MGKFDGRRGSRTPLERAVRRVFVPWVKRELEPAEGGAVLVREVLARAAEDEQLRDELDLDRDHAVRHVSRMLRIALHPHLGGLGWEYEKSTWKNESVFVGITWRKPRKGEMAVNPPRRRSKAEAAEERQRRLRARGVEFPTSRLLPWDRA